ncbi:MAG: hypothetical protein ACP5RH_13245 [Leptodesmis sp.]|uniref:hypothetical protein n=1 Tax=Leptodesmis sp. TaxID=3100501 RepID=UPI003D12C00C
MEEANQNQSSKIIISPETDAFVEQAMADQTADLKQETKALIEAIKDALSLKFRQIKI